jgi:CheY-like chemotaxis protein
MTRSKTLSPEHLENASIISRSGEHLLTLINQVLDLSKIEAGRTTLNENNFDLYRLLDDLEDMFQLKADEKGLQLICDRPWRCASSFNAASLTGDRTPEVPRYVCTDEVKLRQVLINLLNNAIKFTPEGGVSVRVGMGNGDKEDERDKEKKKYSPNSQSPNPRCRLVFEVEDTGAGIEPDELDSLFEAFVQTKTGKAAQEGTGLGLLITRQFVQMMGGDITVSSEVGHGTTVKFDINVSVVDAKEIESQQPLRRVIALEPNQPRYRILIVDDKPTNRQLLIKLLNPLGFELREACNGSEAIAVWETFQPHLIWMDMRMPIMDGYEATRRIKAEFRRMLAQRHVVQDERISDSESQHLPLDNPLPGSSFTLYTFPVIIALTASSLEEERAVVLSAGCDDFMRKPFRDADIFELMHKHIGVRFVYEDPTQRDFSLIRNGEQESLTVDAIAALPEAWVANLKQAILNVDLKLILALIEQIRSENASLANALIHCIDNFEYDKILNLITASAGQKK